MQKFHYYQDCIWEAEPTPPLEMKRIAVIVCKISRKVAESWPYVDDSTGRWGVNSHPFYFEISASGELRPKIGELEEEAALHLERVKHVLARVGGLQAAECQEPNTQPKNDKGKPGRSTNFPGGLTWDKVTVRVKSKDTIQIAAAGVAENFSFERIGLKDSRAVDRPRKAWILLLFFAVEPLVTANLQTEGQKKAEKRIQEIRECFKCAVGIEDDPFHPYRRNHGWRPKFTIVNDSGLTKEELSKDLSPATNKTLEDYCKTSVAAAIDDFEESEQEYYRQQSSANDDD